MILEKNLKQLKACVIIPTYNNAPFLKGVLDDVLSYTDEIIVVNDGCTDGSAAILKEYAQLKIIELSENGGKGNALKVGFEKAIEMGFERAITMDSDGQHLAKDLVNLVTEANQFPDALIVGARILVQENMPGKNSFANKFSNFWFRFETGIDAPDTQSGFRYYPLHLFKNTRYFSWKYEFELEVLVRAAWKGVPLKFVKIDVYYPPPEERISHFKSVPDFTRISILNTIFVLIALLYIKPRDFFRNLKKKVREHFSKSTYMTAKSR